MCCRRRERRHAEPDTPPHMPKAQRWERHSATAMAWTCSKRQSAQQGGSLANLRALHAAAQVGQRDGPPVEALGRAGHHARARAARLCSPTQDATGIRE